MKVSILDLHCLNAVCDDYEQLDEIVADVRRSSHGNVVEQEVAACLMDLARDGLVAFFRFDSSTGTYIPQFDPPADLAGVWVTLTEAGRRELNANWVDD
jgi:hypothetical protein